MNEERSRRDRQLAARISDGDPAALEELYDAYAGAVYRQARAIVGCVCEAEDVVQEVFLKLVRRRGGPIQDPKAYLLTATRHQAYSALRLRRREDTDSDLLIAHADAARGPGASDETQAVREALRALPDEQREVVLLKIYEQWTFEEIGRAVKASVNTVASRYRYALKKLRQALGDSPHG